MRAIAWALIVSVCLLLAGESAVGQASVALLGSADYKPTPEQPVGWRGDWTGRFPGATAPMEWSRRVKGITSEIRYQTDKPAGLATGEVGKDAKPLEYFTIKDWLVAGPFAVDDPVKDIDKDFLGGEDKVEPVKDAKAGPSTGSGQATWKFLRADVETQSRHECNSGTCGDSNVDFIFAFGKFPERSPAKPREFTVEGSFTNQAAYAHAYIHSPAEAKVQLRMPFDGTAGRFWLNGSTVSSPSNGKPTDLDPKNHGKTFDVSLNKGWNRLLVKITVANGLRGKTGDSDWSSRWLVAAYLAPIGPVSYETKNVAWMTKLPGRSVSQPIVVGDKVFVGSGTSDLLCLDKKTGKVLWIQSNTSFDALTPEQKDVKEKVEPLGAKLSNLNTEAMAAINAAVSPQGLPSKEAGDLDQKFRAKDAAEKALQDALAAIDKKKYSPMYFNEVSAGNATACSDGQFVYWACGGGQGWRKTATYVISCFTLDGKRVWTVLDDTLGVMEHGNHTSPTLIDGKLIWAANKSLVALDAKTGKELWRNTPNDWTNELCASSPVVTTLGRDKAIVGNRYIHRISDGSVIGTSHISDSFNSVATPVVNNGVLYNTGQNAGGDKLATFLAAKLPASAEAKAEILWAPDGREVNSLSRGSNFMIASPLYADGIVYSIDMSGALSALDPAAKKCVYQKWLDGYNRYNRMVYGICASPTLGGKNIYITDDAGFTHILAPGPQFKEVGRNVLENINLSGAGGNPCKQESFGTSPWFEGKFMYLRGEEYLYCIGGN